VAASASLDLAYVGLPDDGSNCEFTLRDAQDLAGVPELEAKEHAFLEPAPQLGLIRGLRCFPLGQPVGCLGGH
jgi:hypothetical protein